jgi:hypothetical protein
MDFAKKPSSKLSFQMKRGCVARQMMERRAGDTFRGILVSTQIERN